MKEASFIKICRMNRRRRSRRNQLGQTAPSCRPWTIVYDEALVSVHVLHHGPLSVANGPPHLHRLEDADRRMALNDGPIFLGHLTDRKPDRPQRNAEQEGAHDTMPHIRTAEYDSRADGEKQNRGWSRLNS